MRSGRPKPLPPPSPTRESCGSCGTCCKLLEVPSLNKPTCQWCVHAKPGRLPGACTIYEARPIECRTFRCLWLMSHEDADKTPMPMMVRPDRSHVCFGALLMNGEAMEMGTAAHVDPAYPNAWLEWPMHQMMQQMVAQGVTIIIYCAGARKLWDRNGIRNIEPETKDG